MRGEMNMPLDLDYKFEDFKEYYGDAKQVKKQIYECKECGKKLVFSHFSDYQNLVIQETSTCPECINVTKKIIHVLN